MGANPTNAEYAMGLAQSHNCNYAYSTLVYILGSGSFVGACTSVSAFCTTSNAMTAISACVTVLAECLVPSPDNIS